MELPRSPGTASAPLWTIAEEDELPESAALVKDRLVYGSAGSDLPEAVLDDRRIGGTHRQASGNRILHLHCDRRADLRVEEFSGTRTHTLVDAVYFGIVTMCTIGYGDIAPVSSTTKLYCCVFVVIGMGFIDVLLSGMVAYILERQEELLMTLWRVAAIKLRGASLVLVNTRGRMRKRMKVVLALGVVIGCVTLGTLAVHKLEELSWVDSFYLSCISVTTVGYGDHAFESLAGRLFASMWLLISSLAVARAFLFLAEARIARRNRLIAKWVLTREMTVGDLVAADIDNNGFVSKSEFVVYKLKELGKISQDDIMEVCRQFNIMDRDNSGRITLSCLSDAV
ncbi:LOW QUALITY PROTEIN: two pore potassium channel c [Selaginella moellendorffii]|uniref:LOW QUALITY PROTEIN: two pore potassium channel c n=1 Tax=Selaginella moellendorffii TaxID=88036 RepID=UPI000D1CA15B|nr:LOW QUALITY PROTEIN: two pore potassium channel c [Selaginella moellendorffii]|eukprot:XP_024520485.1 LOW QUALITY PROTEIN: two pore potassium channel c [Selaginella moellendorffii]